MKCKICNTEFLKSTGRINSDFIGIRFSPSNRDIENGVIFSDQATGILKQELFKAKLDIRYFYLTSIWPYKPNKNKECFNAHLEEIVSILPNYKAGILFGVETIRTLSNAETANVSSLKIFSDYTSIPLMGCVLPSEVYQNGVGELRLALNKFNLIVEKVGIL